jgi:DNA-binding IclR family transcriptional regulator
MERNLSPFIGLLFFSKSGYAGPDGKRFSHYGDGGRMSDGQDEIGAKSQVVERTCRILREVARRGHAGARLLDLTTATELSRPTVHRILQSLIQERFIQQKASRRYHLGTALYEIGLSAPSPVGDLEPFREIIQDLANRCGDTVYLAIRRGDRSFYLLRCEGAFPIRTHVVNAGETLPLVGSHAGHAFLAAMDPAEAEEIIRRAEKTPDLFGAGNAEFLRDEIERIRAQGYGWAKDVTIKGVAGVCVPVPNPNGQPYLAVTISAISSRLEQSRLADLIRMLLQTAQSVSAAIRND